MKNMGNTNFSRAIALSVGVLTLTFLIGLAVSAWTEPSVVPPDGNVSAPINVGLTAQTKAGTLTITGGAAFGTYSPDTKYRVTTPTFYAAQALIGNATTSGTFTVSTLTGCSSPTTGKLYADAAGKITCGTDQTGSSLPAGTSGQTLRYDTAWVANSIIYNNGTNVGIGTTAPSSKLHIAARSNALRIGDSTASYPDLILGISDSTTNNGADISITGSGNGGSAYLTNYIQNYGGAFYWQFGSAGGPVTISTMAPAGLTLSGALMVNGTGNSYIQGNVGIGTTAPAAKLQINPATGIEGLRIISSTFSPLTIRNAADNADLFRVNQTGTTTLAGNLIIGGGTGKLTVGTIDPVFEIGGEKYATYVADFSGGTRIEASGVIELSSDYIIDFNALEKGSDLWLFWQASNKNFNDLAVLLTPSFDRNVWYEKQGNKLIIHANKSGEVSYRLSAPRIDNKDWSNLVEDQNASGIKIDNYGK